MGIQYEHNKNIETKRIKMLTHYAYIDDDVDYDQAVKIFPHDQSENRFARTTTIVFQLLRLPWEGHVPNKSTQKCFSNQGISFHSFVQIVQ